MSNFHTLTNFFSSRTPVILHSGAANQLKMQIHSYIKDKPNYICDFKCNTATSKANISSGSLAPSFGFTVQQNKLVAGRYIVHTVKQHGYGNGRAPPHKYMACLGTCQDATSHTNGCTMNFEVENGELTKFEHKYIMTKNEFHFADSNNDGKLTLEEHRASNHPADFGMLDKNNDGNVTIDEVNGNGTQQVTTIDCSNSKLTGDGSGHAFGSDQQGWFCCSGNNYQNTPSCSTTVGSNENMKCVKNCSNLQCDVSMTFTLSIYSVYVGVVNALTTLSDGNIASGSNFRPIRLWNGSTGAPQSVINKLVGHSAPVRALTTLNDGNIVSGSEDHSIKIWNISTGAVINAMAGGHNDFVTALTTISDDKIASGSLDTTIKIWYISTGARIHTLKVPTGTAVLALTTLSDGNIASGSSDNAINIWNVSTGALIKTLTGHRAPVYALTPLHDGNIASGSDDYTIMIWNIETGAIIKTLKGHSNNVRALTTLRDGNIASGSDDETIKIWNIKTGVLTQTLDTGHTGNVRAITTLSDGKIASGSIANTIKIWPTG